MRLLCLAVLTLCAASADAQPTLGRDRAPAVPAGIRVYVDRLYSPEPRTRAEAACQLRRNHRDATPAIPILLSMLSDDVVVDALECHMSPWLRQQLRVSTDARQWSQTSPAKEAAETLGDIGDAAVPGLLTALRHADWRTRKFAAHGLGEAEPLHDGLKVIAALSDRLTDEHADVRERSAWALGEIENPVAVPAVARTLQNDRDRRVRLRAAWALGEIEDAGAVNGLVAVLTEADVELRKMAIWALGEIEDASAIPGLVKALGDADISVRRQVVWALGEIEDRSAVNGLVSVLKDADVELRKKAAWALGEIEDASAVPGLSQALRDDADVGVRREAAWALGEIEDRSAVDALLQALKDRDWPVRKMAAWALGEIEDPRALDALQATRYDANVEVRRAVMDAIRELRHR